MPSLRVVAGLSGVKASNCLEVDMDEWTYSAEEPLSTMGAGPCIAIVVHKSNQGCLAHVAHTSMSQTELYHKACFTTREMILRIGGSSFDIFLGGGWAYHLGSYFVSKDLAFLDFKEYLTRFLAEMDVTATILDGRSLAPTKENSAKHPGAASVVYDPTNGLVCVLTDQKEKSAAQTGKKSKATQVCR